MGCLPNLVVVGAMKCGTTSLHDYLDLHPSIGMSRPKEVNFFAGGNSRQTLEWYSSLFDEQYKVRGESSQNYSKRHHPHFVGAFSRMFEAIPKSKLIYVVRDPIERYKSHLAYNYFNETVVTNEFNHRIDHYMKTGLYHYQLLEMIKFYDISQILVVDVSKLRSKRHRTLNEIFNFLNVEELPDDGRFDFERNKHEEARVPKRVRTKLAVRAASKVAPELTRRMLTSGPIGERIRKNGMKQLEPAREMELRDLYHEDTEKLRRLLGQKFETWSV